MGVDRADLNGDGIELAFLEAVPEEVDAGTDLSLTVRVLSPPDLDLHHAPFLILAEDDVRLTGELPDFTGKDGDRATIRLVAPEEVGEFAWSLVILRHQSDGAVCQGASLPFSFRTRRHVTSLAVWDCPSPIAIGEAFRLKVGAQCGATCTSLPCKEIEVHDEADAVVGSAPLGATPWPGTDALYWAEVDLTAPATVWKSSIAS